MKYTLVIHEKVFEEVHDAVLYYENKQPELGIKFINDWENTINLISDNPLSFQKIFKEYRQILLNKFPYLVMYKVEEKNVFVYHFINAKKHPSKRYK